MVFFFRRQRPTLVQASGRTPRPQKLPPVNQPHAAASQNPPLNRLPPRPPRPQPPPLPRGPPPPHGNPPRGGGERLRPGTQGTFGGGNSPDRVGGPRPPAGPAGRGNGGGEGAWPEEDSTPLWRASSSKFVAVSATMLVRRAIVASPCGADRISCRTGLVPAVSPADARGPPCWRKTLAWRCSTTVNVWRRSSEGTGT